MSWDPHSTSPERRTELPAPRPAAGAFYRPLLWRVGSRERQPKQERDSLRSRSKEGRPGSRKHRRWSHSVELVGSLRKLMVARGEDNLPEDVDGVADVRAEQRPSAFYRLMEHEGPETALDAWADAESRRRRREESPGREQRRAERPKAPTTLAEERRRVVRRAFGDCWQYVSRDQSVQDLIVKLEDGANKAFGSKQCKETDAELEWLVNWTGEELATEAGSPPAQEMKLLGLDGVQRKVVHNLASLLGLRSESVVLDSFSDELQKALTLRPLRHLNCGAESNWIAPFSVAQVLTMTAAA